MLPNVATAPLPLYQAAAFDPLKDRVIWNALKTELARPFIEK